MALGKFPIWTRGIALAVGLSACGTEANNPLVLAGTGAINRLTNPAPAPVNARAVLTREVIDQAGQPLLLGDIPSRGVSATLISVATSGDRTTWSTASGILLVLKGDFVDRTQGLGPDLASSDTSEVARLVRGQRAGQAVRIHSYLNGENQQFFRSYSCAVEPRGRVRIESFGRSYATREVFERCTTTDGSFENRYFVGADGVIWRSDQWIGPEIGRISLEYLRRN